MITVQPHQVAAAFMMLDRLTPTERPAAQMALLMEMFGFGQDSAHAAIEEASRVRFRCDITEISHAA